MRIAEAVTPRLFLTAVCLALTLLPASAPARGEAYTVRAQFIALEEATLAAGLSAKVDEVAVREGEAFEEGRSLVVMDCSGRKAERDRAAAELTATRTQVKANEELAKYNSISHVEVQLSKAARDMAAAELKVADAALQHCVEKAPFPGRVAQVFVKAHQWVEPGHPLMTILNPASLEAECIVPSKWLRWLDAGHEVDILVDETGQTVHAVVAAVSPHVDPVSQTVKVRARVEAVPGLLPGMSGTAAFHPPE